MADLESVLGLDENDIAEELHFDTRSEATASDDNSSASTSISSSSRVAKKRGKIRRILKPTKGLVEKKDKNTKAAEDSDKSDVDEVRPNPPIDSDSESENSDSAANIKRNGSRKLPTECKTPEKKISGKQRSYDYMTKLNYLFRDTRFFLIKSNNIENINISKAKGVWATLIQNDANLTQAFKESRNVLLIFSVNESGKFAGFARIAAPSSRDIPQIEWVLPPTISSKALGGVIQLDWICRKELSFNATLHLHNSWNEGKPVKIGRDGQEIEPKVAADLCRLFPEDDKIEMTPILRKSKETAKVMREKGIHVVYKPPRNLSSRSRGRGSNFGPLRNRRHFGFSSDSPRRSRPYKSHRRSLESDRYRRSSPPPYRHGSTGLKGAKDDVGLSQWERYMSSTVAEAYVADYMRAMNNQLPPLPFMPPFGQFPLPGSINSANGALPLNSGGKSIYDQMTLPGRYYDGPGAPPLPEYPLPQTQRPPSFEDFAAWKSGGTHVPPPPPILSSTSAGSSNTTASNSGGGAPLAGASVSYRNLRNSSDINRVRERRDYGRRTQLSRGGGSDRDRHTLRNYRNRR